jgi:VWFA-related protein
MARLLVTLAAVSPAFAFAFIFPMPDASMSDARVELQNAAPLTSGRVNKVYLTVTEGTGAPVLDLTSEDFLVKEDGKDRDVLNARLARDPLQLMILVDDNGTGIFRSGLLQFVQQLQGRAEMALSTVVGQTQRVVNYTANAQAVANAIAALTARPGTPDGGQLLEGIYQSAREQEKRESSRPVIVALTVGGEEHSTVPAHVVLDQLAKSGSTLYVIQIANSALRSTVQVTQPRQLLGENLNLSAVLGEGPKQTGGWREEIVATTGLVLGLGRIAAELKNQYALEYSRPPKGKPLEKLNVSVKRHGLTLRAPTKVAGR